MHGFRLGLTAVALAAAAAPAWAQTPVYFTADNGDTMRQGAAGSTIATLPTGNPADVDLVGDTLYYTDFTTDQFYSVPAAGGSATSFFNASVAFTPSNPSIFSIAITPDASTAYFGESLSKGIYTVPVSGGSPTKIVDLTAVTNYSVNSATTAPKGITIAGNKVYWTDSTSDVTARANLDGSGAEVILNNRTLNGGLNNAFNALTIDPNGGKIYYADDTTDSIYVSNLDGSSAGLFKSLAGTLPGTFAPQDIEYLDGQLFVADTTQGVYTINLSTTAVSAYFGTDVDARGVAVPEPASAAVLGLAALGLVARRRRVA